MIVRAGEVIKGKGEGAASLGAQPSLGAPAIAGHPSAQPADPQPKKTTTADKGVCAG